MDMNEDTPGKVRGKLTSQQRDEEQGHRGVTRSFGGNRERLIGLVPGEACPRHIPASWP